MNRLEILNEIDEIISIYDENGATKQLDKRLEFLRNQLTNRTEKKKRIEKLLCKGQDLTKSEILWLINQEVSKIKIKKALKVDEEFFRQYLRDIGAPMNNTKKSKGATVMKAKGDIEQGKKLLKETDLSVPEIAKRTGASEPNLYYHAKKIRTKRKADPVKENTSKKEKASKEPVNKNDELDRLKSEKEKAEKIAENLQVDVQNLLREREDRESREAIVRDRMIHLSDQKDSWRKKAFEFEEKYKSALKQHDALLQYVFFYTKSRTLMEGELE